MLWNNLLPNLQGFHELLMKRIAHQRTTWFDSSESSDENGKKKFCIHYPLSTIWIWTIIEHGLEFSPLNSTDKTHC